MEAVMDPKSILLAIDGHPSSLRAVDYVGRLASGCPGFKVAIMHVIEDPPEDYFETDTEKLKHLEEETTKAQELLNQARTTLISLGMDSTQISFKSPVKSCSSMASCILEEAEESFGTLVVGRRGIPREEEFAFGSVSKKLVDFAEKCTIWVVH
jgi:nucleotide-binding universal stress UspA family protein